MSPEQVIEKAFAEGTWYKVQSNTKGYTDVFFDVPGSPRAQVRLTFTESGRLISANFQDTNNFVNGLNRGDYRWEEPNKAIDRLFPEVLPEGGPGETPGEAGVPGGDEAGGSGGPGSGCCVPPVNNIEDPEEFPPGY